jgi:colanic acid biosynthesis glycosyl transferase WcaI
MVLIHSLVFIPDGVSTAYLYNDIALGLIEHGFDVVVLTTTPHYNLIESELVKQPI